MKTPNRASISAKTQETGKKLVRQGRRSLKAFMQDEDGFVSRDTMLKVGFTMVAGMGMMGGALAEPPADVGHSEVTKHDNLQFEKGSHQLYLTVGDGDPAAISLPYENYCAEGKMYYLKETVTDPTCKHSNTPGQDDYERGPGGDDFKGIIYKRKPTCYNDLNKMENEIKSFPDLDENSPNGPWRDCPGHTNYAEKGQHWSAAKHDNAVQCDMKPEPSSECSVMDAKHLNVVTHVNYFAY